MSLYERLLACIPDESIELGIAIQHIESGEETRINADAIFPTASVFKVPVMVEVFKQARAGKFDLNDRLELRDRHKTLTSGVLQELQEGLQPTIRDLMILMTIVSDNTATTMLMELVGAENVTATMHELGLTSIHVNMTVHEMFLHAFGIRDRSDIRVDELRAIACKVQMDYSSRTFSRSQDNNVSSAADMTRLMVMIFKGEVVDRAACDEMLDILSRQQHESRVPLFLPWNTVYHKTGTMRGLRNDSGVIYCNQDSHVAFTIFSFDRVELPLSNPRVRVERTWLVEKMMGEMGLILFEHYGGQFPPG
ncbi:MAG: serine hydrolase [Anaerolineae bacterium]